VAFSLRWTKIFPERAAFVLGTPLYRPIEKGTTLHGG